MRMIAQVQNARSQLTSSASTRKKRVNVTVNADGIVIATKFGPRVEDLSYSELAKAFTEAAQAAAADVARKGQELMAPLHDRRARLPKLSDLIEGMPDVSGMTPPAPEVTTAPPDTAVGRVYGAGPEDESVVMEFSDVEPHDQHSWTNRGVTDTSW
ncbi:YbaB/EbfC family nucleoid-associated protein [Nocardia donostiensis]|nr:YbaB/EbfC family nucleoid-associated protein [Nocardia donostiensis]